MKLTLPPQIRKEGKKEKKKEKEKERKNCTHVYGKIESNLVHVLFSHFIVSKHLLDKAWN